MFKDLYIVSGRKFPKPIHVELSDKRLIVCMFKAFGEYFLCQPFLIHNDKTVAIWTPLNNFRVFVIVRSIPTLFYVF